MAPPRPPPIGADHLGEPRLPARRLVVSTFPGLAILITVLGFNLLGDGLRDLRRSAAAPVALMSEAILEIRGLQLSIGTDEGRRQDPRTRRFPLARGHILGSVGKSGCGKSTVVRAILGLLPSGAPIEAGEIVEGEDLLGPASGR